MGITAKFFRSGEAHDFRNLRRRPQAARPRRGARRPLRARQAPRHRADVRRAPTISSRRVRETLARDGSCGSRRGDGHRLHANFAAALAQRQELCRDSSGPSGLNAARTRCISARSSGVNISGMSSFFSMPTPCSPVSAPPTATQCRMISPPAATTRCKLLAIALVEQNQRMQVAVARMKNIADLQIVFAADFLDAPQRFRQAACAESRHPARNTSARGGPGRRRRSCGPSTADRARGSSRATRTSRA